MVRPPLVSWRYNSSRTLRCIQPLAHRFNHSLINLPRQPDTAEDEEPVRREYHVCSVSQVQINSAIDSAVIMI